MKLIVGLGNPGKRYEKTRHNVGFMVLDEIQRSLEHLGMTKWELSKKFNAAITGCTYDGEKILLVKPQTFMNNSGHAVGLIARYYKLTPKDIIVVHDDKDLEIGEIKIQEDRGHAGHNGVRSIIQMVGSKAFARVRVGIAVDSRKMKNTASFVLGKFGFFEKRHVQDIIKQTVEKTLELVK